MNTITKLAALVLIVIGLSACGKMGELEPIKTGAVALAYVEIHNV